MSAFMGLAIGAIVGSIVGTFAMCVVATGARADDMSSVASYRDMYERAYDECNRERLAREAIGDWCAELWDMSAPDHCVTCNHLGICGADMDPTRCYVAECLSDLGVDVERHERSRGFVSQCEEEDE